LDANLVSELTKISVATLPAAASEHGWVGQEKSMSAHRSRGGCSRINASEPTTFLHKEPIVQPESFAQMRSRCARLTHDPSIRLGRIALQIEAAQPLWLRQSALIARVVRLIG
jgi:hypothetical protein